MTSLMAIQEEFQNSLLREYSNIKSFLNKPPIGEISTRLNVYQAGYVLRLVEVLEYEFPAIKQLLGDKAFYAAAEKYILKNPSKHFSLDTLGEKFYTFLKGTAPYKNRPYLAELADFEWQLSEIFILNSGMIMKKDELVKFAENDLVEYTFLPQETLRIKNYCYNISEFYSEFSQEELNKKPFKFEKRQEMIVFWQHLETSYYKKIEDKKEQILLNAWYEKISFSDMGDILYKCFADEKQDEPQNIAVLASQALAGYLHNWLDLGWIKYV